MKYKALYDSFVARDFKYRGNTFKVWQYSIMYHTVVCTVCKIDWFIPEDKLGVFSLSSTRFPRNYDGLTQLQKLHVPVSLVR